MVSLDELIAPPPPSSTDELAESLARSHAAVRRRSSGGVRREVRRLALAFQACERRAARITSPSPAVARAAEWLLDNQHVIEEALQHVVESLPPGYYRELPRLTTGPYAGRPRILAIAIESLREADGHLDVERARRFVEAYQRVQPLRMGELWAFPTLLRLALLQDLRRHVENLFTDGAAGDGSAAGGVGEASRVATGVIGLRQLAAHDWKEVFESLSRVERLLRQDPGGVYGGMEFATRDVYRKAVEHIARERRGIAAGIDEEQVAAAAIELSRDAGGAEAGRRGHVGYYLVDDGLALLEQRLAVRVPVSRSIPRALFRRAAVLYLISVGALTAALLVTAGSVVLDALAPDAATAPRGPGFVLLALLAFAAAALVPASTVAVSLVNWIVTRAVRPRLLPKLDFEEGVPDACRTIVVVPCVLTSPDEIAAHVAELEVNYLGNSEPNVLFALLSDFGDADRHHLPEDTELLDLAREGVSRLNERHGKAFYLLHRERRWNASEGRWMGWERKRGKLHELNRLLRGATDTSFSVQTGPLDVLPSVRYVLTIDADTFLPPAAGRRLIATLAHPLNGAELDGAGRVLKGYSILQPRVEITPVSATRTAFARIYEADNVLDLYTHAVSDVYQDLAGEGVFAGKGLYDPDAFERSLEGRVPENALLSHDLFEGVHGRAALVSDVAVFERYPSHVLTYMRRVHRWVRGDWQLLPWLLRTVPGEGGRRLRNPLSLLGRWKIADNLRRSLFAPSLIALTVVGWLWLPGPAWAWALVAAGVLGVPFLLQAAATLQRLLSPSGARPVLGRHRLRPAVREAFASLGAGVGRWALGVVFLPYEAAVVVDAIARTLYRVLVSRRNLLEWTTAAGAAREMSDATSQLYLWRS
nr:glycosyl transferase family 36 [Gemmatimonadota bacterium]